jgi:hypothetical protein
MSETPWRVGERYELLSQMAVGAGSALWRGRDIEDGSACAVRILRPELAADPAAVEQLRQTLGTVAALGNPGIAAVGELVVQEGWVALVSRLVPGPSLRALLDARGRLPAERATALAGQISQALSAAHAVGVAHGNLTAAQILIDTSRPESGEAVLTDFGLAALVNHAAAHGVLPYVPSSRYRAPELRQGDPGTAAADMFAVGVLLYEALAGCHPFELSPEGDAVLVRRSEPDPIAGLSPGLWHLVTGCLAPNPINRPSAFAAARVLSDPTPTVPIVLSAAAAVATLTPAPGPAAPLPSQQDNPTVFMPVIRPETSPVPVVRAAISAADQNADEAPDGRGGWRAAGMRQRVLFSGLALSAVAVAIIFAFTGVQPGGSNTSNGASIPVEVPSGQSAQAAAAGSATASAHASSTASHSASATASSSASASAGASASASAAAGGSPGASTPASASASSASITPANGVHTSPTAVSGSNLANTSSGKCLDTQNGALASGTAIQLWTCGGASGEGWTLGAGGTLTQGGGAYCLDDYRFDASPGARVVLWSCNGGSNQQWTLRSDGTLLNAYSKLCLDVSGRSTDNGAQIVQSACGGSSSQRWSWQ